MNENIKAHNDPSISHEFPAIVGHIKKSVDDVYHHHQGSDEELAKDKPALVSKCVSRNVHNVAKELRHKLGIHNVYQAVFDIESGKVNWIKKVDKVGPHKKK